MAPAETPSLLESIRARMRQNDFRISKHAVRRMDLRARTLADVQQVVLRGELIREYPDEVPYPEYLFLGYPGSSGTPCYVVVASNDETVIVTVHDHDPEVYEPDHRTRREKQ